MDRHKLGLLLHTLKYLRLKQVLFRLFYMIRNRFLKKDYTKLLSKELEFLYWKNSVYYPVSFKSKNKFSFLNINYFFEDDINWNTNNFGKLWTYNLNYFDFLNQENSNVEEGLSLIKDYIQKDAVLKDGKEPYPISLRGINWIKFLSENKIQDRNINQVLYNHYQILAHNIEYHLLGNHLLENGFSLFFGAYYFKDELLYKKAKKILEEELKEQLLNDGAHFELSPMYHQILLHRLLDCIQLAKLNNWKQDGLLEFLKEKAIKMLAWLNTVTYKSGNVPMVNDCAFDIAPTSKQLFSYAKQIGLHWGLASLSESGYRKFKRDKYELFVDVGNVGPTYQPGHAHSDTFNFELYVNGNPIIVDTGTSTYEKNNKRQSERATIAHNTVKIGDVEQTQVWGGFRVAKRAEIIQLKETENEVEATHNGYVSIGILHSRKFVVREDVVQIYDELSKNTNKEQIAFFHLHPSIQNVKIIENSVELYPNIQILFNSNKIKIEKETYEYASGFNKTKEAIVIKVFFNLTLETKISF